MTGIAVPYAAIPWVTGVLCLGAAVLALRASWRNGVLALALVCLAIASFLPMPDPERGGDHDALPVVWLVVDTSRSMLVRDVGRSRLEHAKRMMMDLVEALPGWQVGVLEFAGEPRLVSPPTRDTTILRDRIGELDLAFDLLAGTELSSAATWLRDHAIGRADHAKGLRERAVVVLFSDGGGSEAFHPDSVGRELQSLGITVHTVGIGDPDVAGPVPMGGSRDPFGGQFTATSRLQEPPLVELALASGGAYVPARTTSPDLASLFQETLLPMTATSDQASGEGRTDVLEAWQLWTVASLLFAALSFWMLRGDYA